MRDNANPHEPVPRHPPITTRGVLVVAAALAAFPAMLFAIAHPTLAVTSLLVIGAATTAASRE